MSLLDFSITGVPTFLRLVAGLVFSLSVTILFICGAWYVVMVFVQYHIRYITWRLCLSKAPFMSDIIGAGESKSSEL